MYENGAARKDGFRLRAVEVDNVYNAHGTREEIAKGKKLRV